MDFKTVKLKVIKRNIRAKWKCPDCDRLNSEWIYNDPQKQALKCAYCGEWFKGEIK